MFTNILKVFLLATIVGQAADSPETVLATYRIKKRMETEFQSVHAAAWNAYRKYGLVLTATHPVVKGKEESGASFFVEILTWKDHDAPDHVPEEVKAIWKQMEALCEKRDGHPGIEFTEVEVVKEN